MEHARRDTGGAVASRLVKKVKISLDAGNDDNSACSPRVRLQHPLGVKPIGNYFEDVVKGAVECRASGLGRLAVMQDTQLLSLLNYCSAADLQTWQPVVALPTYLKTKYGNKVQLKAPIRVQGVYSDLLFQSYYCSAAPIEETWLACQEHDSGGFKRDFEGPNVPVIITDAIDDWAAINKWTDEYLGHVCKGKTFYAGGFQFSMDKYFNYCRTLLDDQPLFVFDKEFAAKVPQLAKDYTVPEYFQEDYFALLGEEKRPDYRWLIIGPKKSGSSFHIDPNATNAWNGVIRGSKKWIMFPPGQVPPGIHPSEDGSEVSAPVSLMEWFVTFYKDVQMLPAHLKPLEGICREGETMFVPHGWWHTVLNIDESVAMTQNFVSSSNVKSVLEFLTDKPEQVSGCPMEQRPKLGGMFREVMAKNAPELYAKVDKELKDEYERKHRKSKWELLIHGEDNKKETSPTRQVILQRQQQAVRATSASALTLIEL
ncbi:JmjC domain [Phytophthora cactorum]|nr:JmjC domain [Phytophthora cactorum]